MRKVALRGLLTRKLRLGLTALAIALGVTLIAGTYVFTDTINRSFDRIFTESNKGVDTAITPREALQTRPAARSRRCPPRCSSACAGAPRRGRGRGRRPRPGGRPSTSDGDRLGGGAVAELRRLGLARAPLPGQHGRGGPAAARAATRPRSTRRPPTARTCSLGDTIVVQGDRGPAAVPARRLHARSAASTRSAAPRSSRSSCPVAQALLGMAGRFDDDPGRRPAGHRRPRSCARGCAAAVGRDAVVRTGEEEARSQSRRDQGRPRLPQHGAAGLRRHLAVRRRLHHLQHLLDHDRRSACASSRCCGRSAPRAGQVLRSVLGEGAVLGRARVARRPGPGRR